MWITTRSASSRISPYSWKFPVFEQSEYTLLRTLISDSLRTLDPFLISRRISEPPAAPLGRDGSISFQFWLCRSPCVCVFYQNPPSDFYAADIPSSQRSQRDYQLGATTSSFFGILTSREIRSVTRRDVIMTYLATSNTPRTISAIGYPSCESRTSVSLKPNDQLYEVGYSTLQGRLSDFLMTDRRV